MAPKLKNVALKKSVRIVSEILRDIIEEVMEPSGQRLKDKLRDNVLELLFEGSADISAVGEIDMLIAKHALRKTSYAEKIRGIVAEFFGDVAVGTIEEPPEPFFECGDSVVYTGVEERFNGRQLTRGMHGHVVEGPMGILLTDFVKVHFDVVGRAVLGKRNLVLDGGDKLLIIPAESRRLTSTSLAQHNCGPGWIRRSCPGCQKTWPLTTYDIGSVCEQCNAMTDKVHADVEITRCLHAGFVDIKFTLKEFKGGAFTQKAKMGKIDKLIAGTKLTKDYKNALIRISRKGYHYTERYGEKKAPVSQAARQKRNCRGSDASSSHQCPGRPLATATNNVASSADMDRNSREQYWREVYSQPVLYQSPHHEVAQYFWNFSRNALTPIGTGQDEGRGQGRREEEEWLSYQTQATKEEWLSYQTQTRNTETQEVPQPHREAQPEINECVICCEEASTHAMVPCGHHCVCQGCAKGFAEGKFNDCPICRGEVQKVIHIFRS